MLVIGLAMLLQLTPTNAAEGYPYRTTPGVTTATGDQLLSSANSMPATLTLTYTAWLPYMAKDFKLADGPFGAQIYGASPTAIDRMSDLGTAWVRLPLNWCVIEPQNRTPENYAWPASFEQQLAALSAHHIRVVLLFGCNPSWAATYLNGPIDLVEISELTEFMQATVARYSQPPYNVKHWEMYNEPDNGNVLFAEQGHGYFGHTPEAYVDILEAVYQPIKAVDPEAKVLLGGLAYDAWPDPFVEDFLDQVLINGGGAHFDVMNFHYYRAFRENWEPYGHDILGKLAFLRDKLASYGVDKPFVCTETGWFSNFQQGNGHEIQSRYVVQGFVRSLTTDMELVIWYTLVDDVDDLRNWGLLDVDWNPKPSYDAYQTLTAQLSGAHLVGEVDFTGAGLDYLEGYEFVTRAGDTSIVVWVDGDTVVLLRWAASQVTMIDKLGSETIIYDDDDGLLDGFVSCLVGPSPVYLRFDGGAGR
ncbi:MAG: hypothetical protein JXM73_00075 [Anaerolineae bacterium]|nr:hypothetical protein [Anaerolineae bacterium]